jgi:NADH-quinone oxidoreductase subunit C
MHATDIATLLRERIGAEAVGELVTGEGIKDPFVVVAASALVDACGILRADERFAFDFLQCLTAVDYPREGKLVCVYHLYSYPHRHAFVVKVELPRDAPVCPSVTAIWKTANWLEREQYDLFGVQFTGHPELRRLLMPDDWVGYPMRKDYVEAGDYRGMSTRRYSVMALLSAYDKQHPQPEGERPRVVESEDPPSKE